MAKTLIIAEAGVNHNGDMAIAKRLIDVAANSGVDYVKFQTFNASKLVSKKAKKAEYQEINSQVKESQFQMLKRLELSKSDHIELIEYCKIKNVRFLSTAFDLDSVNLLAELGVTLGKVPSGELTNLPYLRMIAATFPEIIISTGMAQMDEVMASVKALLDAGTKKENLSVLHCNTEYPTPFEDVNLGAMLHLKKELGLPFGYSDHTLGIEVPIAAVALGATIIEKHFTLDRKLDGPDHRASLEPEELVQMVTSIRNIEKAVSGSGIKMPSPSEAKNRPVARKSIVARRLINHGELFDINNITVKRPGTGISPMMWDQVIGTKAIKSFDEDENIVL